jgi:uncharacterized lipoprotein NlpE involved in copper resistance
MVKKILFLLLAVSLFIVVGCNQNSFEEQRQIDQVEELDDRELEIALNEKGKIDESESIVGQATKSKKLSVGCTESDSKLILAKGKWDRELDRFFCSAGNSLLRVCTESGFTSHLNEKCKYGCIDGACVDPYEEQGEGDLITEENQDIKQVDIGIEVPQAIVVNEMEESEPASGELTCNDVISVNEAFNIGDERFTYVSSSSPVENKPSAMVFSQTIGKNIDYNIITSDCSKDGFCVNEFTMRWEGKGYKFVSKLTNQADFDVIYTCDVEESAKTDFY